MIETRPATYLDAFELAPRLRQEDAEEIASVWRIPPFDGLVLCLLRSDRAFSLVVDGTVVGLWGATESRCGGLKIGVPWMLAAHALFTRRRELISRSRGWVDGLLLDYDVLTNLTNAANHAHLRWLAWCGFRALRVHRAYGADAVPFCEFYRVNRLRRACERGVRETLLVRDVPDWRLSIATLLNAATAAVRTLAEPRGSQAAAETAVMRLLQAVPGSALPGRYRLLVELARHSLRHGDGGSGAEGVAWRWCRQMVAVAEICSLERGSDPVEVARALEQVPARAAAGIGGPRAAQRGSSAGPDEGRLRADVLAVDLVSGLTLGGRVSRAQGRRLRLAALGLEPGHAERAAGIARTELSALWAGRTSSSLRPGDVRGRRQWASRLWRAAGGRDALSSALTAALQSLPADRGRGPSSDCLSCAAMLADGMARRWVPGLRCAGVSTDFPERQKVYWLLRAWLVETMTGSAEHAAMALAEDVAALLLVGEAETGMLGRECRNVVEEDRIDALRAIERHFPERARGWQRHLLPVVLAPGIHVAQLEPALVAWDLTCRGEIRIRAQELADASRAHSGACASGFRSAWSAVVGRIDPAELGRRLAAGTGGSDRSD